MSPRAVDPSGASCSTTPPRGRRDLQGHGQTVKLMWHRTDDFRQGARNPCPPRGSGPHALGQVLTYDQRHTSVSTDFGHGVGEIITSEAARLPSAVSPSRRRSSLSPSRPLQLRCRHPAAQRDRPRVQHRFHAQHLLAQRALRAGARGGRAGETAGQGPYAVRRAFLKDGRARAVLDKAAEVGDWGRSMPSGTDRASRSTPSTTRTSPSSPRSTVGRRPPGRKIRDASPDPVSPGSSARWTWASPSTRVASRPR